MQSEVETPRPVIWMAALGLTCVAIVVWGYFNPALDMRDVASAAGFGVGTAAIAGPLFTLLFGRFWRGKGWFAFGAIALAMLTSSLVTTERNRIDVRKLTTFLREEVLLGASTDPLTPVPNLVPKEQQAGDIGSVQTFVTEMYNRQAEAQRSYLAAIDALGWEKVLDPARIDLDVQFSGTQKMLDGIRALVTKFRNADLVALEGLAVKAKALDLRSSDARRGLIAGVERSLTENKPGLLELWRLESEVVDRIETVARFLHERRGSWTYDEGQLLFDADDDVAAYNDALAAVDETIAAQDSLRALQLQKAEGKLKTAERRFGMQ